MHLAIRVQRTQRIGLDLLHLLHHRRRNRPHPAPRAHEHRLRHGERQRQEQVEARPLAGLRMHVDAAAERDDLAAHDVHADAAAGDLRERRRRRKAWLKQAFDELVDRRLRIGLHEAERNRTFAHALEIDAAAVVRDLDRDFIADLAHGQRDLAGLRLPRGHARGTRLDAVIERVAQQVLERADELLEDRAVELGLRAVDFQVGALVELARGLAQNPVQPLGQAAERNGADREQPLLHVARQPRLRDQRHIGVVEVLEERLLHGRHVVDAFGERARQLLETRVAVELQRVEILARCTGERHARLDLRFGRELDLAHLAAQPDHAVRELEQIRLQRAQFAFDARAGDGHLSGFVHELVDDVGAHAKQRARRVGLGMVDAARRRRRACRRLRACAGARRNGAFRRDRFRDGRCRRRHRFRRGKPRQRDVGLAFAQRIEHEADAVEIGVERLEQFAARRDRRVAQRQARLHPVRELAEPHRARHARAALQRVQRAPQLRAARSVVGRAPPCAQAFAGLREELAGFLEKDRKNRLVDVVGDVEQ